MTSQNTADGRTIFEVGTPVVYEGKFATVTGRDNGEERAIIEFCDHRDGRFRTVRDADLVLDQDSMDEEAALKASSGAA